MACSARALAPADSARLLAMIVILPRMTPDAIYSVAVANFDPSFTIYRFDTGPPERYLKRKD
jgi:hypothetical protein